MAAFRLPSTLLFTAGLLAAGAPPSAAQLQRLSVSSAGVQGNGASDQPAIDHSGRFVAFRSAASNLVAGGANGVADVFVRDRDTDADGVFDEPGAVSTTRVSVATGGAQADAPSEQPWLGADGRFVVFVSAATTLATPPDGGNVPIAARQVYRHDRQTGETRLVSRGVTQSAADADCDAPVVSQDGRYVAFTSRATNLVAADPGTGGGVYLRDMESGGLIRLTEALPLPAQPRQPGGASYSVGPVSIDAAGRLVAYAIVLHSSYRTFSSDVGELRVYDIAAGTTRAAVAAGHTPVLLDGGRALGYLDATTGGIWSTDFRRGGWLDLESGATATLAFDELLTPKAIAWSPGGRFAAYLTRDATERQAPNPDPRPEEPYLFDHSLDASWLLPAGTRLGPLDAAGRFIAFAGDSASLVPADTNAAADVFALDLAAFFDADGDTLDDRWEGTVGLSTSAGTGADGPSGDPDGDGVTNADELARGTHPRGSVVRYLAEGASGSFFSTQIALANPSASAAGVVVRFSTDTGQQRWRYLRVPAGSRRTVDAETIDGLEATAFATAVESDAPVVVDRRVVWGGGYGAHGETSLAAAHTDWHFAEGATGGGFDLFYLLQNPADTPVTVGVTYLLPAGGAPIERTYTLAARSRTTIHVDGVAPALAASDVSAAITASGPIIAERAMYMSDGTLFRGGHASAGITALSPSWFFAEGATGGFFDLFLLLANPGTLPVVVQVDYLTEGGAVLSKSYSVAARSRRTVWVDDESFGGAGKALATGAVSMRVSAPAPIAAERAMWWPGGGSWHEGHATAGATTTATRWAVADAGLYGPQDVRSYVLIANPGAADATVRITLLLDEVTVAPLAPATVTVRAGSRFTYDLSAAPVPWSATAERRFGVLVESLAPASAPVVVERAVYWTVGGVPFEAGLGALAVPLP